MGYYGSSGHLCLLEEDAGRHDIVEEEGRVRDMVPQQRTWWSAEQKHIGSYTSRNYGVAGAGRGGEDRSTGPAPHLRCSASRTARGGRREHKSTAAAPPSPLSKQDSEGRTGP